MNQRKPNVSGRVRMFDFAARESFREAVRAAPLDEQRAATIAIDLATRCIKLIPSDLQPGLLASLIHLKVIGYNGNLYMHAIRLVRALAAADHWLQGCQRLEFQLQDLWLGEYYLLHRCLQRGIEVDLPWHRDQMYRRLVLPTANRPQAPDFQPHEVNVREPSPEPHRFEPADAFFVASMPNYLNPMIPVMDRLAAKGRKVTALVTRSMLPRASAVRGVQWVTFESLVTANDARRRDSFTMSAASWIASTSLSPPVIHAEGIDLWPVIASDLGHVASDVVPDALTMHAIAQRAIEQSCAKIVVVARLRRATELAFAKAADDARSRIVMLLHGHISNSPALRFDAGEFDPCDIVCAWGEAQATTLGTMVKKGTRVATTGNPQWDDIAARGLAPAPSRARVRERCAGDLKLDNQMLWCVWLSQDLSRNAFAMVQRVVLDVPGAMLIVKVHPSEDPSAYTALVNPRQADRVRISHSSPPLHDLLEAADLAMTFHSTTNIEALLLGTPVITVVPKELATLDRVVYLEHFGQPVATDEVSLATIMRECAQQHQANPLVLRESALRAARRIVAHGPGLPPAIERVCAEMGL